MGSQDSWVAGKGAHLPSLPVSVASMRPTQHSTCLGLPRVYLPVGWVPMRDRAALFHLPLAFIVHTGRMEAGERCTCDYFRTHTVARPDAQEGPLLPGRPGSPVYISVVFRDFI